MGGRFILSFDCEGKWGVADVLTAREHERLGQERLKWAYRSIVGLLDEFEMPATFAFVGAFSQSARDFARIRPLLEDLRRSAPNYLGPALQDIAEGSREGWHGDWAVEAVAGGRARREIALHGVSHVPWTWVDSGFVEAELAVVPELAGPIRDSRTFVYPRNLVAHESMLSKAGFEGYRTGRNPTRLTSFLSEFDLLSGPESDIERDNGLQPIPAGYFVNWQHGLRRAVPIALSAHRARRMIERAARTGGVVHYWLHPENVASAPATLDLLREIVRVAAEARDRGCCTVLTQLDYCRALASPQPASREVLAD